MKLAQKYPVLGSSVDATKLSTTIKGTVALIASLAAYFGLVIPLSDLSPLIDTIGTFVVEITGVVSTGIALYGGIRRLINKYK